MERRRWQWKVTPKEPSANERLTIRALLVYPNDPNKAAVEITSYTAEVSVQVGSLWEWGKYLFLERSGWVAEVSAAGRRRICFCGGAGGVVVEAKAPGEERQRVAATGSLWVGGVGRRG